MKTILRQRCLPFLLCAGLFACSAEEAPEPEATPVAQKAPLEPLPALRMGTRDVDQAEVLLATPIASFKDTSHEYLEFSLPLGGANDVSAIDRQHIELADATPGDLALVTRSEGSLRLLLRRRLESVAGNAGGALYSSSWASREMRWLRQPFSLAEAKSVLDPALKTRWISAFTEQNSAAGISHPWWRFAAGRVQALQSDGLIALQTAPTDPNQRNRRTELTQLMDTTTGMLSMQEALQYDRGLRLDRSPAPRDIPIDALKLPDLVAHPFAAMQASLAKPDAGTPEPMAAAVPSEFWYARVDDIRLLLRLLDEADTWITPAVQILQSNPEDRHLADRYQAQLGLNRSGLAKVLGHTVVGPVALAGSDPYLREGSDLTMIFQVKQQTIFDAELARHLDSYRASTPGLSSGTRQHGGINIQVNTDPAGRLRQQRAQIGDLAIVSNSATACDRIIDAIQGKTDRLSEEADLNYMLARDPGRHQALVFMSDKFIAAAIGPQQKILAARRQQALAELLTPGYAALLHGWLFGSAPASTDALIASGLLAADELRHNDGAKIEFNPGSSARSRWGSPAALTPLIDLTPVAQVSAAEKSAYELFVATYQQYWRQFIDPVAIRIDLKEAAGQTTAEIDVRILPLISGTEYSEIEQVVGTTRVAVGAYDRGVQSVWAVGPDARLRLELDGLLRSATGQNDIGLGWLGDWVALGLDDRASVVELLSRLDSDVQLPMVRPQGSQFDDTELWRAIGKFPVYAAAEVRNPLMLVATLTAIRTMIGQVAPGWVNWGESEKYRDQAIVRISASSTAPVPNPEVIDAVTLHYVNTGSAFVLALNVETLKHQVDRLLDGAAPKAAPEGPAQFVFEGRSEPGAPIWTAFLWLIQGQANNAQSSARRSAEILLRGDPALQQQPGLLAQRGLDYLGYAPVTAHGDSIFLLKPEGVGDAVSGTDIAPHYGVLPIPGSPVAKLMQHLTRLRGEISFDKEPAAAGPNARSLHTRFELELGAP